MTVRYLLGTGGWRGSPSVHLRRYGVPVGGAWDSESANYARALANLPHTYEFFELLQGTCEFEFQESGSLCLVGLDVRFDSLQFQGCRPVAAGSRHTVSGHLAYACFAAEAVEASLNWKLELPDRVRYLPVEYSKPFSASVLPAFNRMGVRFASNIDLSLSERPSEPCCMGAIQRTPSGELIVIGPDGPTIGGYPKLGTVIEADLDLIPRLRIGQELRFEPVDFESAVTLLTQRRRMVESRVAYFRGTGRADLG